MPRKPKEIISIQVAVQLSVEHALYEMNERGVTYCCFSFSVKDLDHVMMMNLNGIPSPEETKKIVTDGLKKGNYAIFVAADIKEDREENLIHIAAFDKDHKQHGYISPCKIQDGKVVQSPKVSKKGFQSFLDDDE